MWKEPCLSCHEITQKMEKGGGEQEKSEWKHIQMLNYEFKFIYEFEDWGNLCWLAIGYIIRAQNPFNTFFSCIHTFILAINSRDARMIQSDFILFSFAFWLFTGSFVCNQLSHWLNSKICDTEQKKRILQSCHNK